MSEENKVVERVTISGEVLNEVLNVLGQLPYVQSANVIKKIQEDIRPIVEGVHEDAPEAVNE